MHQHAVRSEQIVLGLSAPTRHRIVGRERVTDFLDFAWQTQNPLAIQQGGYLLHAQGVVLDGERRLDGADTVASAQLWRQRAITVGSQQSHLLADFGNQSQNAGGHRQWWLVIAHCLQPMGISRHLNPQIRRG